jgi:hypothetical protein
MRVIVSRSLPGGVRLAETVDLLFALLSFENFDVLAGPERTPEEVAPLVKRAAAAIVAPKPRKAHKPNEIRDVRKPGSAPRGRAG